MNRERERERRPESRKMLILFGKKRDGGKFSDGKKTSLVATRMNAHGGHYHLLLVARMYVQYVGREIGR